MKNFIVTSLLLLLTLPAMSQTFRSADEAAYSGALTLVSEMPYRKSITGYVVKTVTGYKFYRYTLGENPKLEGPVVALFTARGRSRSQDSVFFASETKLADTTNMPIYLVDYTGYLKMYQPGDDKIHSRELHKRGQAKGSYVSYNGKAVRVPIEF